MFIKSESFSILNDIIKGHCFAAPHSGYAYPDSQREGNYECEPREEWSFRIKTTSN